MGLSASQARMLSLTSRMSDLELKAQTISNSKVRLGDQSEQAARLYSDSLDKTKLQVYSGLKSDGSATYVDATAHNLTNYNAISTTDKQRFLKDTSGRVIISSDVAKRYEASGGDLEAFLNAEGFTQYANSDEAQEGLVNGLVSELTTNCSAVSSALTTPVEIQAKADAANAAAATATAASNAASANAAAAEAAKTKAASIAYNISMVAGSSFNSTADVAARDAANLAAVAADAKNVADAAVSNGNGDTSIQAKAGEAATAAQNAKKAAEAAAAALDSGANATTVNSYANTAADAAAAATAAAASATALAATIASKAAADEAVKAAAAKATASALQASANQANSGVMSAIKPQIAKIGEILSKIDNYYTQSNLTNYKSVVTSSSFCQKPSDFSSVKSVLTNIAGMMSSSKGTIISASTYSPDYSTDGSAADYYKNVFNEIKESGGYNVQSEENMNSSEWLQAQLQAGNISLHEWNKDAGTDGKGDFVGVSWKSGDSTLQQTTNESDMAKAEADYETTMASIETKDKRFDLQLSQINTEHSAIQTEMESVKKVIDKNIERSFKSFDA